jgi:hypothetical protein
MKLTKKAIDAIRSNGTDCVYWDDELRGFGLRVKPSGSRVHIIEAVRDDQGDWPFNLTRDVEALARACSNSSGDTYVSVFDFFGFRAVSCGEDRHPSGREIETRLTAVLPELRSGEARVFSATLRGQSRGGRQCFAAFHIHHWRAPASRGASGATPTPRS